ncbi:sensor histidine kinase [Pseudarthrobacter sp. NPDC058119]|uniref:sensor histidine kinase n=1 Tax=Pseudarthrobacter sp. NPDC058119 TaxID=3346348 RepID=UPI0036D9B4EF
MRTRLLLVLAVLGAIVVAAFAFPLAATVAEARTREFVLSRDADLQRFADLADGYARTGNTGLLREEAEAYTSLYGEALAVVSTRGSAPITTAGASLDEPQVSAAIERALRNERSSAVELITPWSTGTAVFGKPIGTGAQVNGAVVIMASTESARIDILRGWLAIGAGALGAVIGFAALALAVSRWILRPLENVSARMQQLTRSLPFVALNSGNTDVTTPTGRAGPPELRALSTAFQKMDTAVITSGEAQRRLVADAAHQLRNPLAALQLRLDTLTPRVQEEGRRSHERAIDEAIRLEKILDDLLALSVAEVPRREAAGDERTCTPHAIAVERAGYWHETAAEAGVTFEVAERPDEPTARIGAGDLEQILDVLFDNICKYSGRGTTVRISSDTIGKTADALPTDRRTVLTVSDNGAGVKDEELPLISRRFFRGTSRAPEEDGVRPGGTGLGLSIVEALVESNGGSMELGRTQGGGLTVVMSFEAAPGDTRHPASNPEADVDRTAKTGDT